jgi:hypothetical protein
MTHDEFDARCETIESLLDQIITHAGDDETEHDYERLAACTKWLGTEIGELRKRLGMLGSIGEYKGKWYARTDSDEFGEPKRATADGRLIFDRTPNRDCHGPFEEPGAAFLWLGLWRQDAGRIEK